jgi:hypothetical protein
MGLDELHLRVLATSSENPKEKRNAQKGSKRFQTANRTRFSKLIDDHLVLNLLRRGRHWVLVVSVDHYHPMILLSYQPDTQVLLLSNVVRRFELASGVVRSY